MNKRTPQEWADWTGGYVAQDKDKDWFLYRDKPEIDTHRGHWKTENAYYISIPKGLIDIPADHDWTTLYEPRKADNAPHQSEVFIHGEYALVGGDSQTDLSGKVNVMMNHGWKLQGGVAVEHLPISDGYVNDRSFFYQAMVRGL